MHLHAVATAGVEHRYVGCDYCRYAGLRGSGHDAVEVIEVVVVDNGIYRQIGFHAGSAAAAHDFGKVVESEVGARPRAHVKAFYSEIHSVGTGIDSCRQ